MKLKLNFSESCLFYFKRLNCIKIVFYNIKLTGAILQNEYIYF